MKTEANNKEILEMILQFLFENNYNQSASLLENKANIIFDQNEMQKLKHNLNSHLFDEAIKIITESNYEKNQKLEVLRLIKSKKYIDLIQADERNKALDFLRNELTPVFTESESDKEILKKISSLLFKKDPKTLEKYLANNFPDFISDNNIIQKIQDLLCLSFDTKGNKILPNNRLESLANIYNDFRINNKMDIDDTHPDYFEIDKKTSILSKNFIIEKHDDEVWFIEFTESLNYFATCSRNGMIAIYKNVMKPLKITIDCINYFQANRKYITSLAWSKSEKFLFTSSSDKSIKMWDPYEGKCIKTFTLHSDIVNCVKMLDETTFVSGGIDKKLIICKTDNTIVSTDQFYRIRELLISYALNYIVVIPASLNEIILFDYKKLKDEKKINMQDPIISAALSKSDDGIFLITNLSKINASINLYNLQDLSLINKYYGHIQEQYIIKCSFSGENDEYIISGSEDFSIFIWHRSNSIPLYNLYGHTGAVNSVEWINNKSYSAMYSVADDYTLRIWTDNKLEVEFNDIKKKGINCKKEVNLVSNGIANGNGIGNNLIKNNNNNNTHEFLDLIGNENASVTSNENVDVNVEDNESENSS